MITIKIDKDDVQYNAEGRGINILAESGVAIVNIIKIMRDVADYDKLIQHIIDMAIEHEKEME